MCRCGVAALFDVKHKNADDDQPVEIQDDVWIGAGSIILKGVCIGRGSIVAAGSVVTKSCDPYSVLAGVPARVVKKRFKYEQMVEHERILKTKGS